MIYQKTATRMIRYIPKGIKVWFFIKLRRYFTPARAAKKETTKPMARKWICPTSNCPAF
jgi:hypothetical protein